MTLRRPGPTHHGIFDISYLRCLPNIIVMAPKDEDELQDMMFTMTLQPHPVAIRYPRGPAEGVPVKDRPGVIEIGKAEVLRHFANNGGRKIAFFAVGVGSCGRSVARRCGGAGRGEAGQDPGEEDAWAAAAVEGVAEDRRADEEVVAGQAEGDGDGADGEELEGPVQRPFGDEDLQPDHEGEVDEVGPVGGVGDVADDRVGARAEDAKHAQGEENAGPHGQGVARVMDEVGEGRVRMSGIAFDAAQPKDHGNAEDGQRGTARCESGQARD